MTDYDFEDELKNKQKLIEDLLTKLGVYKNNHNFSVIMSLVAMVLLLAEQFGYGSWINWMFIVAPLALDVAVKCWAVVVNVFVKT